MTEQDTIENLRKLIKKKLMEVRESDSPKSMHEMGVELTKAASTCLKVIDNLKSKANLPSARAQAAVTAHIEALERIFNDMWQSPLSYLDNTPEDVVMKRRTDLDDRETSLIDHAMQESENNNLKQTSSAMTHCNICGITLDRKLQPTCPNCADE